MQQNEVPDFDLDESDLSFGEENQEQEELVVDSGLLSDDDIEEEEEAPAPPAPAPAPAKAQKPPKPNVKEDNLPTILPSVKTEIKPGGLDFAALMRSTGLAPQPTGTIVPKFPIEKAKFSAGDRKFISFLSDDVVIMKVHYGEACGYVECFDGQCCKDMDLPNVRYTYPIVIYDMDKKGTVLSKDLRHMALVLSASTYESIAVASGFSGGQLTQGTYIVTCSDEQYQKIILQKIADAPLYEKSSSMQQDIASFWGTHMKDFTRAVARKVTPKEYAELVSQFQKSNTAAAPVMDMSQIDSLLGG